MSLQQLLERLAEQGSDMTEGNKSYLEGSQHYRDLDIEPLDAMAAWMPVHQRIGFARGNCLKYLARMDRKGAPLEDARKAAHYAHLLVELLEKGE